MAVDLEKMERDVAKLKANLVREEGRIREARKEMGDSAFVVFGGSRYTRDDLRARRPGVQDGRGQPQEQGGGRRRQASPPDAREEEARRAPDDPQPDARPTSSGSRPSWPWSARPRRPASRRSTTRATARSARTWRASATGSTPQEVARAARRAARPAGRRAQDAADHRDRPVHRGPLRRSPEGRREVRGLTTESQSAQRNTQMKRVEDGRHGVCLRTLASAVSSSVHSVTLWLDIWRFSMFGFAWLTLRQAQEALRTGRLDEALRLLEQPAVRNHRKAGSLLLDLGRAHVERGERHLQNEDAGPPGPTCSRPRSSARRSAPATGCGSRSRRSASPRPAPCSRRATSPGPRRSSPASANAPSTPPSWASSKRACATGCGPASWPPEGDFALAAEAADPGRPAARRQPPPRRVPGRPGPPPGHVPRPARPPARRRPARGVARGRRAGRAGPRRRPPARRGRGPAQPRLAGARTRDRRRTPAPTGTAARPRRPRRASSCGSTASAATSSASATGSPSARRCRGRASMCRSSPTCRGCTPP